MTIFGICRTVVRQAQSLDKGVGSTYRNFVTITWVCAICVFCGILFSNAFWCILNFFALFPLRKKKNLIISELNVSQKKGLVVSDQGSMQKEVK